MGLMLRNNVPGAGVGHCENRKNLFGAFGVSGVDMDVDFNTSHGPEPRFPERQFPFPVKIFNPQLIFLTRPKV